MKHLLALTFMINVFCSYTLAASYYVRSGATGTKTGSDWNNAWTSLSQINFTLINPGDTIYLGSGTYTGEFIINKSGTAGNPITFKRATTASHGSDVGWNDTFAGTVIIDGGNGMAAIHIGGHYITIDGATKYGIWLRNAMYGIRCSDRFNNLTVRYLDIGDPGTYQLGEDGIQGSGDNLLVEYSYIHDNDNIDTHGDGIQWFAGNNITIRYNIMKNNGQVMMLTETVWGNDYINDLNVYYNIFYNRSGSHYNGISKKLCPQAGHYWRIYNNTWDLGADTSTNWADDIFGGAGACTLMEFKNNALIRTRVNTISGVTHSFNGFDTANPYGVYDGTTVTAPAENNRVVATDLGFVNIDAADFHLTASSPLVGKGSNVGLTKDFDGNPVPATPSIGAFELPTGNQPPPPPTLLAPKNLRVQ